MKSIIVGLTILISLASCTSKESSKNGQTSIDTKAGEAVYNANCAVCHQIGGAGVPSAFPPLAENPFLEGDKSTLIQIILKGKTGESLVKGVKYNGVMTPFANLSDQEIADLLTYLRTSLGNHADAITAEEVRKERVKN